MKSLGSTIFFVLAFPSVCFGDWLCLSEDAAGYAFNETIDDWNPSVFSNGTRLLLREGEAGDDVYNKNHIPNWALVGIGEQHPRLVCNSEFSYNDDLQCENFLQLFGLTKISFDLCIYTKPVT